MTKVEFIPILEAALRQADSHIEYISLETKDDWDSIRVYYEDTSTLIIPVPNLSAPLLHPEGMEGGGVSKPGLGVQAFLSGIYAGRLGRTRKNVLT